MSLSACWRINTRISFIESPLKLDSQAGSRIELSGSKGVDRDGYFAVDWVDFGSVVEMNSHSTRAQR